MRTLFDQYAQPENRLTHALVTSLNEDPRFLQSFLRWLKVSPPRGEALQVVEQVMPGEVEEQAETSELDNPRIPDAWIYTESGWALLIESKVAAPVNPAQLRGHLAVAESRGFSDLQLVVLSPIAPTCSLPDRCSHRRWSDVYRLACADAPSSDWAAHLARYFPVAEQRMVDSAYLKEGTLTTFTGIPFRPDYPYNYLEAKRLLRLLMAELRADDSLDVLGVDRAAAGRAAITGSAHTSVWDYISLADAVGDTFTRSPHLTLSIERDRAIVHLTFPNGLESSRRRRLLDQGHAGLKAALSDFVDAVGPVLADDPGAVPYVQVLQRHYASQRSIPVRDAIIEFDARTALGGGASVRGQEQWLQATFDALARRQSNLQLSVGVAFAYGASTRVSAPEFAEVAARAWRATAPLLRLLEAPTAASSSESGGESSARTTRAQRRTRARSAAVDARRVEERSA